MDDERPFTWNDLDTADPFWHEVKTLALRAMAKSDQQQAARAERENGEERE